MNDLNSPNSSAAPVAGKRPRAAAAYEDDQEDVAENNVPDLASYFAEFGLHPVDQIGICRTYANYLAQLVRTQLPDPEGEGDKKKGKKK